MRARLTFVLALSAAACAASSSTLEITKEANQGLTACVAGAPPSNGFATVPALGDQAFQFPVAMQAIPGDRTRFYVVEKKGTVRRAGADGTASVALDIRERVNAGPNEAGLLGLALHPKFTENGFVYLSYTKPSATSPANLASVIARASTRDSGMTIDPTSLVELLSFDQPFANHNGGHITFGPDGFLYASFGDGGSGGDPQGNGQKLTTLLGKILRLDVDGGAPYAIPSDNPFREGGGRAEIYAFGLRNTWRFSFDRLTGELWAGDVGQNRFEEIDRIVLGGNYGWGLKEAFSCFNAATCTVPNAIDPVVAYDRTQGFSVTGGFVYRGSAIPELSGKYVFGDFGSGKIWSIPTAPVAAGAPPPAMDLLTASGLSISSFAEDNDGELYVLDFGQGKVKKIVRTFTSEGIPEKLSQTGCFQASDPKVPTDRLVEYNVNSPLWSDGADKARWLALPENGKIKVGEGGRWEFPPGSVLAKEFKLGGKRIETRLFMRHTDGSWAGYTYEWNDAETDATLLADGKTKDVAGQTWTYPSRSQCISCHNSATGGTIGLETAQLNGAHTYPDGVTMNQLAKLESLGAFAAPLPAERPALVSPTSTTASTEEKARSYLHANCAFCHRPQGPGRGAADFRFSRTFKGTRICNTVPEAGDFGIEGAKLFAPGDPDTSIISLRIHATGEIRMPPIGTSIEDTTGTTLVDDWIRSVTACP
jgi:uncharacterized repeat protein (TIGR03806 family)